jgi:thymidine kinase
MGIRCSFTLVGFLINATKSNTLTKTQSKTYATVRQMPGKITVVIGPMFAGKTTELQRRIKREIYACRQVCIVRYGKDDRYSKSLLATHDQAHVRPTYSVERLAQIGDAWREFDAIAIDEGQFFPDLIDFCSSAADAGKTVIVSALDGDFMRRPFGKICDLIPMAEEVVKITAVCMACHERDAHFTRRTVEGTQTELIGGAESYIAVCRECYNHPHPPTPGRVNRYRENVREVERLTLRGRRDSVGGAAAPAADSGTENVKGGATITATEGVASRASPVAAATGALRRSRSQNAQPGALAPGAGASARCTTMAPATDLPEDSVSNAMPPMSPSVAAPQLPQLGSV